MDEVVCPNGESIPRDLTTINPTLLYPISTTLHREPLSTTNLAGPHRISTASLFKNYT
jgi:hypothetical protein